MKKIVIFATFPSREEAEKASSVLLDEKLIACANIIGDVSSFFWWNAKIDSAHEVMMIAKTNESLFAEVEQTLKKNHSYEVPEIIGLPICVGSQSYLDWIDESVKG